MPSSLGSGPNPVCRACLEPVPGLAWGARCQACQAVRKRRATSLARRFSLLAALLAVVILNWRSPPGQDTRVLVGAGTLATFVLVRVIAYRLAMEVLPEQKA